MVLAEILLVVYIVKPEKLKIFLMKQRYKKIKITKQSRAYRRYASAYNVQIWNSFNLELQLKDTKSAIRNKLKGLLIELKGISLW